MLIQMVEKQEHKERIKAFVESYINFLEQETVLIKRISSHLLDQDMYLRKVFSHAILDLLKGEIEPDQANQTNLILNPGGSLLNVALFKLSCINLLYDLIQYSQLLHEMKESVKLLSDIILMNYEELEKIVFELNQIINSLALMINQFNIFTLDQLSFSILDLNNQIDEKMMQVNEYTGNIVNFFFEVIQKINDLVKEFTKEDVSLSNNLH